MQHSTCNSTCCDETHCGLGITIGVATDEGITKNYEFLRVVCYGLNNESNDTAEPGAAVVVGTGSATVPAGAATGGGAAASSLLVTGLEMGLSSLPGNSFDVCPATLAMMLCHFLASSGVWALKANS